MNEFLTNYGLWLVIGLIILITLVYLISGKKSSADAGPTVETPVAEREIAPPPVSVTPPPAAADPMPVTVPPLPEAVIADAVVPSVSVPIATAVPASVPPAGGDNLLQLKGVGPKLAALLGELGVTSFAQIADWTDSDLAAVDAKLGNFKGRPVRDHWIDQAKYLAAGDVAGFEAKYGKL